VTAMMLHDCTETRPDEAAEGGFLGSSSSTFMPSPGASYGHRWSLGRRRGMGHDRDLHLGSASLGPGRSSSSPSSIHGIF